MQDVERLLAKSSLPMEARDRIRSVVASAGLRGDRALDVTCELIAHFEDGMASGRSQEEMLESFGDQDLASRLIGRSKARAERARSGSIAGSRGDSFVAKFARDVRYSLRRMAQSPGFTATAILSLAVGIGANAAIFSLVNAVILRKTPIPEPEQLVEIYTWKASFNNNIFSYPDFRDVRDNSDDIFEAVSASGYAFVPIDVAGSVEMLAAEVVSGKYFSLLGVQPAVGRLLGPEDDVAPGAHPVVVLDHGYWQRAYGGDPGVVGETLRVTGVEYTIVGVLPEWYRGNVRGLVPSLYFPVLMMNQVQPGTVDRLEQRGGHWLFGKGRLKAGVTLAEAHARLDTIAAELRASYPQEWNRDEHFFLVRSNEVIMFPPIDRFVVPTAGVFMGLVGLVLLVACANLASFLLARAKDRQREIAVRFALGATRRSIVRQLLTETTLLAFFGGLGGLAVSVWLLRILFAADLPLPFPLTLDVSLDANVLAFSLGVSLVAGLFFGVAPALQSSGRNVAATLKDGGTGGSRARRFTLRNVLVAAQVAVSMVLLVAAALFARSMLARQTIDPGFGQQPAGVITIMVPSNRYDRDQGRLFVRRLEERITQIPGVEAVGLIDNLHLNPMSTNMMDVNIDGVVPPAGQNSHVVDDAIGDAGFFEAAGVRIVRGRNFNDGDTDEATKVAIISAAMAQRFWPDQEAIGRIVRRPDRDDLVVVGVASDAKIRTLGEAPRPFIYTPYSQNYSSFVTLVARTVRDAEATARDMLAVGRELDSELMVYETKSIQRHIDLLLLPDRLGTLVLAAFAAVAMVLASIGLYGIVSYAVAQRTREVGIRISLGADHRSVVRMLTGGGMKLVAVGAGIGLLLAAGMGQVMSGLLLGISALDPVTFLGVPLILFAVALLAAYLPARRASRIDPVVALRTE